MVRMSGIKWDKSTPCRPVHNIISSEFPKYSPQPWKLMEGKPRIEWLLSNEYHRMWFKELDTWKKRMYPESTAVNEDVVKRYVLSFKTNNRVAKPQKRKPFKMKRFEGIGSKTSNLRSPKKEPTIIEKKVSIDELNTVVI